MTALEQIMEHRAARVEGHMRHDLTADEVAHFKLMLAELSALPSQVAAIEHEAAHVGRRNAKHRRQA